MNVLLPFLADADDNDRLLMLKNVGHSGWSSMTIMFGAIGLVAVLSFVLVYCFRNKILGRQRRHRHHRAGQSAATAPGTQPAGEEAGTAQKKSRRFRRGRRTLNPTLAQTHGLPPVRDEDTPPPGL
jgi:hypothetical protein